jgi:hypothetical protein
MKYDILLLRTVVHASLCVLPIFLAGCGGGGGGEEDTGGDDGDVIVDDGDPTPALGCDGAASLGGPYVVEVLDNFDHGTVLSFPFLPIASHLHGRVMELVPVEELLPESCEDDDTCGTVYGATSAGLGTASPSGRHSTLQVMTGANRNLPDIPALAGMVGGVRLEAENLTVWMWSGFATMASDESMQFALQYYVYSGDAIGSERQDTAGVDDDCDGIIDEPDEERLVDTVASDPDTGSPVVGDGIVILKLRR